MAKTQILTNIPEFLTFKFNSWKRWENQGKNGPYITYSIGVEHKGLDEYFTVYEKEYNDIFSKLGDLQGRTLEVGKFQDGKYINWQIKENGQDITPKRSYNAPQASISQVQPQQAHKPTPDQFKALDDKIRAAFEKRDKQISELSEMVIEMKGQLSYFSQMFKLGNPDAFDVHKESLPGIIEELPEKFEFDATKYPKEPEIPIITT